MPSLLSRCFSLFLPHLRTLAQGKRSETVFVLGLVGGVSVCIRYCRVIYIIFPRANNGRPREKKNSGEAICSRYQRALSGFLARLRILNFISGLC